MLDILQLWVLAESVEVWCIQEAMVEVLEVIWENER